MRLFNRRVGEALEPELVADASAAVGDAKTGVLRTAGLLLGRVAEDAGATRDVLAAQLSHCLAAPAGIFLLLLFVLQVAQNVKKKKKIDELSDLLEAAGAAGRTATAKQRQFDAALAKR